MKELNEKERFYYFIFGCILVRSLFILIAKNASENVLFYFGIIALIPSFMFFYLYFSGSRPTGPEAGGEIWWNWARPIHGSLYLIFAILAINNNNKAWIVLLIDLLFGIYITFDHRKYLY